MLNIFYINEIKFSAVILRICSSDAFTYLQGQFSQDLNCPPGNVRYGLWLSDKGRVLADSHVLRLGQNDFVVIGPEDMPAAEFAALTSRNIIADDVEVRDVSADYAVLQLWGAGAEAAAGSVAGGAPASGNFLSSNGTLLFRGRASTVENFQLLVPAGDEAAWREKLTAAGARPATAERMNLERIRAGVVAVPIELGPGDLAAEGGLGETAVCYTKGCYVGQEVANRLKNLGQVRRRLHLVQGLGPPPTVPAELYQAGRRIGELRSVVRDGQEILGVAMLTLASLDTAQGVSTVPAGASELRIVRVL